MEAWASAGLAAEAAYLRHLALAPVAEVIERPGVFAVRTGVHSNSENGVLSSGPLDPALVAELVAWFAQRELPASWRCAEDAALAGTAATLAAAGCERERAAWEMSAPIETLALDAAPQPADVLIEPVATGRGLDAWLDVAGACGWFETPSQRRARHQLLDGLTLTTAPPLRLLTASRGSQPVGMAAAFHTPTTVRLTALAVLPDHRRQGIGRALALERLRQARAHRCTQAVLAPTPQGAELYKSLGFTTHPLPPDRCFHLPPGRHERQPTQRIEDNDR